MSELNKAIKFLKKKFGEDAVWYKGTKAFDEARQSFGNFSLDLNSGGGLPRGKICTIAGKYSSGKTTTAITAIAECQKNGGKVAWVDTDNGLGKNWVSKLGADWDSILKIYPDTIEEVSDAIESLLLSNELDLIVFDSVAATLSGRELENSAEKDSMGGIAKAVGKTMRKATVRIRKSKTSLLILNQLRDTVSGFGASEYMPGGNQLENQSDITIFFRSGSWIGDTNAPIGKAIKYRIKKNRTYIPLVTGEFDLLHKGKINNMKAILKYASDYGIINKSGSWYQYKKKKAHGLKGLVKKLGNEKIKEIGIEVLEKAKEEFFNE